MSFIYPDIAYNRLSDCVNLVSVVLYIEPLILVFDYQLAGSRSRLVS